MSTYLTEEPQNSELKGGMEGAPFDWGVERQHFMAAHRAPWGKGQAPGDRNPHSCLRKRSAVWQVSTLAQG